MRDHSQCCGITVAFATWAGQCSARTDGLPPMTTKTRTDVHCQHFPCRAVKALYRAGIRNVGELLSANPDDIKDLKGVGYGTMQEIEQTLLDGGFAVNWGYLAGRR